MSNAEFHHSIYIFAQFVAFQFEHVASVTPYYVATWACQFMSLSSSLFTTIKVVEDP